MWDFQNLLQKKTKKLVGQNWQYSCKGNVEQLSTATSQVDSCHRIRCCGQLRHFNALLYLALVLIHFPFPMCTLHHFKVSFSAVVESRVCI